jgi:hypothetical protein
MTKENVMLSCCFCVMLMRLCGCVCCVFGFGMGGLCCFQPDTEVLYVILRWLGAV